MAATWTASPAHHPWFKMSSLKRKHSSDADSSTDDDYLDLSVHPSRPTHHGKRRCTTLERELAGLSLSNPVSPNSISPIPVTPSSAYHQAPEPYPPMSMSMPMVMDTDTLPAFEPVVSTGIVEEDLAPEVKMKTSTWYELEKDRE